MAAPGMNIQQLHELKSQAKQLASACQKLDSFLAGQSDRIRREADIDGLNTLIAKIKLHLEEAESSENRERDAEQERDALGRITKAISKGIGSAIGEDARVDIFEKTIAARHSARQHCFGNIMVRVGKNGMPDDVHVVSISEKARMQNRSEAAIMLELRKSGTPLYTPDSFMQLVEELVGDIRKGKLRLPILPEQLIARTVPVNFKPIVHI